MKLINEFCRPLPPAAIEFAESLPFTVYTKGYAQRFYLTRGDKSQYAPTSGILYSDRTPPPKDFLKPGERIIETEIEMYHYEPVMPVQHTHCPYPIDALDSSSPGVLLPPPLFEGQFIRHDVYTSRAHRIGIREYVSTRFWDGKLGWCLVSEWSQEATAVKILGGKSLDIL